MTIFLFSSSILQPHHIFRGEQEGLLLVVLPHLQLMLSQCFVGLFQPVSHLNHKLVAGSGFLWVEADAEFDLAAVAPCSTSAC